MQLQSKLLLVNGKFNSYRELETHMHCKLERAFSCGREISTYLAPSTMCGLDQNWITDFICFHFQQLNVLFSPVVTWD
jgi:hypothetical protein